jgi:hypothetical protein
MEPSMAAGAMVGAHYLYVIARYQLPLSLLVRFFYQPLPQFIPRLPLLPLRSGKRTVVKNIKLPIKPVPTVYRSVLSLVPTARTMVKKNLLHG